jgi:hypothetical protein
MNTMRAPYEAMGVSSSWPPKEDRTLGWVVSFDDMSNGYLGRGCACIEKG